MESAELYNAATLFSSASSIDTAIVAEGKSISYGTLEQATDFWCRQVRQHNVNLGERVAILLPDSADFVAAFLGVLKAGAVAMPLNTFADSAILSDLLVESQAKLIITTCLRAGEIEDISPAPVEVVHSNRCLRLASQQRVAPTTELSPAFWLYTSGSTGTPKAVVHSHGGIRALANGFGKDVLAMTARDRCLSASKLFFAYGLGNSLLMPFSTGASVVLNAKRSDSATLLRLIREQRPTLFFGVPTVYRRLLEYGVNPEDFSSVRSCVSAGEFLPNSLFDAWQAAVGQPLLDGIGSTEAMYIYCSNRPGEIRRGRSGYAVNGYKLRIIDDAGKEALDGAVGQLLVRGPTMMLGYRNGVNAGRDSLRDGWLQTNDLFCKDAIGSYKFCGRQTDTFKSSGQWVSPAEIEQFISSVDGVDQVIVVPDTDELGLSFPIAYVIANGDAPDVISKQIFENLLQLPGFKRPKRIEFLTEFPRTPTGKVCRQSLKNRQN